ncbi:MAG: hypothetical protein ACRDRL_33445 [Sciscionella sp.]
MAGRHHRTTSGTHNIASVYETFEPEEAFALAQQCLDRRINDLEALSTELTAWQNATNADQRHLDWQSRQYGPLVRAAPPRGASHRLGNPHAKRHATLLSDTASWTNRPRTGLNEL